MSTKKSKKKDKKNIEKQGPNNTKEATVSLSALAGGEAKLDDEADTLKDVEGMGATEGISESTEAKDKTEAKNKTEEQKDTKSDEKPNTVEEKAAKKEAEKAEKKAKAEAKKAERAAEKEAKKAAKKDKKAPKGDLLRKLGFTKKGQTSYVEQGKGKGYRIFLFSSVTALLLFVVIGGTILNRRADFFEIAGVEFRPEPYWEVTIRDADEGVEAVVRIDDEEMGGSSLVVIGTKASNTNITLEQNFDVIAIVTEALTDNFETEDIYIDDLPVRIQRYTVTAEGVNFNMIGFLFPNGGELMYIQLGVLEDEGDNLAQIEYVKNLIRGLDLPPIEFMRDSDFEEEVEGE